MNSEVDITQIGDTKRKIVNVATRSIREEEFPRCPKCGAVIVLTFECVSCMTRPRF